MGLKRAFTEQADFGDMIKNEALQISKVVQKAFIEVNEEGSEAAAATGMQLTLMSIEIPMPPADFVADRPFIILLNARGYVVDEEKQSREYFSNVVLFKGRIADPRG
ncbi:uncharacterized protein LOC126749734 isoform X1 [Anthonomus grandis grandis]|uniref:uncharacterized protein LOC126749734 isoform X1 n=1 Tax=Anthonomus grandis grandis TaxID=2921223 RepID=UPI0021654E25|nr:uncharacterized protein LOC126749734 isoform X1 [Anthonomus grandis grandis]